MSQTAVRAPADGFVTVVALTVGDQALQARSAMSFIVGKEIKLVGMFSQNAFETVKEGVAVDIVFDNSPGRIYHAKVTAIPKGIAGHVRQRNRIFREGGVIGLPASILVWIRSYTAYL